MSKAGVSLLAGSLDGAGNLDGTGANARFNSPNGLALDSAGDLVVADTGNQRIRKITPSGVVTTFAGSGQPGHVNGPRLQATFCIPENVAVDSGGNVSVVERSMVRKVAVGSSVTTVAGAAVGELPASLWAPTDAGFDGASNLYIGSTQAIVKARLDN